MSTPELSADAGTTGVNRTGVYLAVLQLVFTPGLDHLRDLSAEACR